MAVRIRREKKTVEVRRRGVDGKKQAQDLGVYRWFAVCIKLALELEGQSFSIHKKKQTIKFDRTHKWWKLIDLKSFPKSPKFLRFDNKLMASQQSKLFNDYFYPKYRDLFLEKETLVGEAVHRSPEDYFTVHFPRNYSLTSMTYDLKKLYADREQGLQKTKGKKSKGDTSKFNAEIVLNDTGGNDLLLKRLFNTITIDLSSPDLSNLDIHFQVQKRMYKNFVIPEIERLNAKVKGDINMRSTRTNSEDYRSQWRMTQRDRRSAKILLINLCKGVFPKIDKVI